MKHVKLFEQFINETINADEAYGNRDSVQTIIDGKRELAFLATMDKAPYGPYDENVLLNIEYAKENGLKFIEVKNRKPGRAWVVYKKNKAMAQELADIAAQYDGFLADQTPFMAKKIGTLLGYKDADIKDYIKRKYGR